MKEFWLSVLMVKIDLKEVLMWSVGAKIILMTEKEHLRDDDSVYRRLELKWRQLG